MILCLGRKRHVDDAEICARGDPNYVLRDSDLHDNKKRLKALML